VVTAQVRQGVLVLGAASSSDAHDPGFGIDWGLNLSGVIVDLNADLLNDTGTGANDGILIEVLSADHGFTVEVRMQHRAPDASLDRLASAPLPVLPTDVFVPFSSINDLQFGSAFTFDDVDRMFVLIESNPDADIRIDAITAAPIPEPGAAALLLLAVYHARHRPRRFESESLREGLATGLDAQTVRIETPGPPVLDARRCGGTSGPEGGQYRKAVSTGRRSVPEGGQYRKASWA